MPTPADDLQKDPLLQSAPSCEGFKVLEPAVLYARLGAGGMGAVYRGRHFSLECDVAVKVLKPDLAHDEQFVSRFSREARLAARISNDNVVRVLDVKEKNGIHYLVMEFVQGETARERVKRKGPLAEAEALAIVYGAAMGLREAHTQGIVHRDIKPDNVLVSAQGAIKLADLGLAKQKQTAGEQNLTVLASGVMGTPQFMPPEQWRTPDVTPAADVWALGATLYYLLAGKSGVPGGEMLVIAEHIRDHDFPNIADVRKDVRPEVAALLAKCTARKPDQRFADARELVKAMRPLLTLDDELLKDPEAGLGNSNLALVTPPPRATLARIKLQVEQDPDEVATRAIGAPAAAAAAAAAAATATAVAPGGAASGPAAPATGTASRGGPPVGTGAASGSALGDAGSATATSPRRGGLLAAALLVAVVGVGATGFAMGWFEPKTPSSPPNRQQQAAKDGAAPGTTLQASGANDANPASDAGKPADTDPPPANAGDKAATTNPTAVVPAATPSEDTKAGETKPPVAPPGDPKPNVPAVVADPQQEAKAALARGLEALPRPTGLDNAIEQFERALQLDASLADAKTNLVRALVQKSRQLVASDPDAAYDAAVRARSFAPGDAAVDAVSTAATTAIQQRLLASTTIRTPDVDAVVGETTVRVEGTVTAPNVRNVRVALEAGERAAAAFPADGAATAAVVGGAFEVALQARGDGPHFVRVQPEDVRGTSTELAPRRIVVDTTSPVVAIDTPADGALVGAAVAVRVRVDDATTRSVTIAGKDATRGADGSFVAELALADGEREFEVKATDGAGRAATAMRRVRVDAAPPSLAIEPPLPVATRDKQVVVRGTVRDANPTTVSVGGNDAPVRAGAFAATIAFDAPREYEIAVIARDAAGNEAPPTVLRVRYDVAAPVLAWSAPVDPPIAGDVEVRGTVRDDSACTVEVNGTPANVTGDTWRATVRVATNAETAIRVTATDAAGNAAEPLTRSLRGEPPLVALSWATPAPEHRRVVVGDEAWPSAVIANGTGIRMVLVPAGEFSMGSPTGEVERGTDENAHVVTIGKPFWLGATEVSQAQWLAVMGQNPSRNREPSHPVDNVSWTDCQAFAQKLGAGYRLPSESEWEYACRAGTTTPFAFGASLASAQANFDGTRPYPGSARSENRRGAVPVGSLPANAWGLHEMHGNVHEWCEDVLQPYGAAGTEAAVGGHGPRVARGGGWNSMASGCRSAFRFGNQQWTKNERLGLRVARSLEPR